MAKTVLDQRLAQNPILASFFARAKEIESCDAAHDFSHIIRVANGTIEIYSNEVQSRENRSITDTENDNCAVAALLHDCVPVPKNSPLRKESSRLSSEKAREWLSESQWPVSSIDEICLAIRDHSFSAGYTPSSLLGESLQDADRLESLGAIGLYRVIATGVSMGTQLFDANDPWAKDRELDDRKFSVDHFFTKLLKLPESFRTEAARAEARKRALFLEGFLRQLGHELQMPYDPNQL